MTGQPTMPRLDRETHRLYRKCQAIRERYPDGVPLNQADRAIVLQVLRKHPRAREKFGPGIDAIIVHHYIGGSRCFFVIRADGTAEDFSVRKALGMSIGKRTPRIAAFMAAFNYQALVQKYRMHRTSQRQRIS